MRQISYIVEAILFRSRFLLAPLYLGLVGSLISANLTALIRSDQR